MRELAFISALCVASAASAGHPAIEAFADHCTTKGMTTEQAFERMAPEAGGFELIFWDKTLAPAPDTPDHVERRCEVRFDGDSAQQAVDAVKAKMVTPPVFGTSIPLQPPYTPTPGTAYIDARELLRGRVAVVHVGVENGETFIRVDRLPAGMGLPE